MVPPACQGSALFGGLGFNPFNPALVGRAFLQAAFPVTMTTWSPPSEGWLHLDASTLAAPLMHAADATTTATPIIMPRIVSTVCSGCCQRWRRLERARIGLTTQNSPDVHRADHSPA